MPSETPQQQAVPPVTAHYYWIPQPQLGVLESEVINLCYLVGQTKRQNRSRFNNLVRALKLLKMIPANAEVLNMGLCCNLNGERGLFVNCYVTVKMQAQLPIPSAYAQERARMDEPGTRDKLIQEDPHPSRGGA